MRYFNNKIVIFFTTLAAAQTLGINLAYACDVREWSRSCDVRLEEFRQTDSVLKMLTEIPSSSIKALIQRNLSEIRTEYGVLTFVSGLSGWKFTFTPNSAVAPGARSAGASGASAPRAFRPSLAIAAQSLGMREESPASPRSGSASPSYSVESPVAVHEPRMPSPVTVAQAVKIVHSVTTSPSTQPVASAFQDAASLATQAVEVAAVGGPRAAAKAAGVAARAQVVASALRGATVVAHLPLPPLVRAAAVLTGGTLGLAAGTAMVTAEALKSGESLAQGVAGTAHVVTQAAAHMEPHFDLDPTGFAVADREKIEHKVPEYHQPKMPEKAQAFVDGVDQVRAAVGLPKNLNEAKDAVVKLWRASTRGGIDVEKAFDVAEAAETAQEKVSALTSAFEKARTGMSRLYSALRAPAAACDEERAKDTQDSGSSSSASWDSTERCDAPASPVAQAPSTSVDEAQEVFDYFSGGDPTFMGT